MLPTAFSWQSDCSVQCSRVLDETRQNLQPSRTDTCPSTSKSTKRMLSSLIGARKRMSGEPIVGESFFFFSSSPMSLIAVIFPLARVWINTGSLLHVLRQVADGEEHF